MPLNQAITPTEVTSVIPSVRRTLKKHGDLSVFVPHVPENDIKNARPAREMTVLSGKLKKKGFTLRLPEPDDSCEQATQKNRPYQSQQKVRCMYQGRTNLENVNHGLVCYRSKSMTEANTQIKACRQGAAAEFKLHRPHVRYSRETV